MGFSDTILDNLTSLLDDLYAEYPVPFYQQKEELCILIANTLQSAHIIDGYSSQRLSHKDAMTGAKKIWMDFIDEKFSI